ncbi:MAG: DUF5714 domain-containing protein [Gudongella sp.]|nr:DUF5714 domain-containing protein [Gudongella sp.]
MKHQNVNYSENCKVCGNELDYHNKGEKLICHNCGITEYANISCSNGHYICDKCHGADAFNMVLEHVVSSESKDPLHIAEELMSMKDEVPMLGCENAWVAAGSLMAALRNEGSVGINNNQVEEVLNRTRSQAIGGYCGLTGVCGIAPGIGACFSVILGAACPKDKETSVTMKVVGRIVNVIADQTGPCCCKNFVRNSLEESIQLVREYLDVDLPENEIRIPCDHVNRHPHGCRKEKCSYWDK